MIVYILVRVDFGHRENVAVCSTKDEARAIKIGYELDLMEEGNACGISYYIEEHQVV